jgi:hypothetical protein
LEKNGPADERVSLVADAGRDGEVEVAGFVDEAAGLAGRLVTSTSARAGDE